MSDLLHRIIIGATVERVYQSIAFPEGIKHWWTQDVTDGGGIGELLELGFNGRKAVLRFSIDEMVTDQRIKWTCIGHASGMEEWPGTTLIWMLSPWKSGGTDLRLTHAGWKSTAGEFPACNTVWGQLLDRLKAAAVGKPRGAMFY